MNDSDSVAKSNYNLIDTPKQCMHIESMRNCRFNYSIRFKINILYNILWIACC